MARQNFTTPVGRMVMGSLYNPQTTDAEGKPLTVKSGPNVGQPKVQFFFALAIPKGTEQHWSQTEWGALIWKTGHEAFPQGQADSPSFAWKIVDGDSTVPNSTGKKPCDREGYPGNWVLSFSSGFAPKIYNKDGTATITEPDAVKLGYYIQVNGDVDGNGSALKPGVFLNHSMVALSAFGEEIQVGRDASQAGFGAAPLPAGAMVTPPASFAPAMPPGTPVWGDPEGPRVGVTPSVVQAPMAPPAPAFLQVPPAPPAAPAHVMLPAAGGATYEAMIAAGWTDALLVAHGMMQG